LSAPTPPLAAQPPSSEAFARLSAVVEADMARLGVPGVALAVQHGEAAHTAAFGITNAEHPLAVDADTLYPIGSLTKPLTGTALARLIEAGALDLAVPLRRYLPELRLADEAVAATITLRHLVTHTAGWPAHFGGLADAGDDALARYVASLAAMPQVLPPGLHFSYGNVGLAVAGRLIERTTGQSYEDALRALVLAPLGMAHTCFSAAEAITHRIAVAHVRRQGEYHVARPWGPPRFMAPAAGAISSLGDLLRFARFHLGNGTAADGTRLLSAEALAGMQAPLGPGGSFVYERLEAVGLTWHLGRVGGARVVQHTGRVSRQSALLLLVPERAFAFCLLANAPAGATLYTTASRWALRELLGLADPPDAPVTPPADALAAYVGHYATPGVAEAAFALDDGAPVLRFRPTNRADEARLRATPVAFLDAESLVATEGALAGFRGEFVRDAAGRVAWLRWLGRLLPRVDGTPVAALATPTTPAD
jgi:CubicO group peptidase (beta-lactamase class C family)